MAYELLIATNAVLRNMRIEGSGQPDHLDFGGSSPDNEILAKYAFVRKTYSERDTVAFLDIPCKCLPSQLQPGCKRYSISVDYSQSQ